MKKKLIALLLALALVFACASALVACNEDPDPDNKDNTGDGTGDKKDNTGDNTGDNKGDTPDPDPMAGVTDANYETFVTSVSGGVLKINLVKVTFSSEVEVKDDEGNVTYKTVKNTVTLSNGEIGVAELAGEEDVTNKVLRFSVVIDAEGEGVAFDGLTGPITLSGQLGTDNLYLLVTDTEGVQQALYGDTPGIVINVLELIKMFIPDAGETETLTDPDSTGDTTGDAVAPAMPTYTAVIKDLITKIEDSIAENGISLPEAGELDPETAKQLASVVKTIATGYFKVEKNDDGRKYTFDSALLKATVDSLGNTELVDLLGGEQAFTAVIAMPSTVLNYRVKDIVQIIDAQLGEGMTTQDILTMVNAVINSYLEDSFGEGVTIEAMLGIKDMTLAEFIMSADIQKMTVREVIVSLTGMTEDDVDTLVKTVTDFLVANKNTTVYGFVAMAVNLAASGSGSDEGTVTEPTEVTADDIAKAVSDIFENYIDKITVTVTVGADGTFKTAGVSADITAGEVEVSFDLAFVANGTLEGDYDNLIEDALKVGQNIGTPTPDTEA